VKTPALSVSLRQDGGQSDACTSGRLVRYHLLPRASLGRL
jgi:hypothetical protein